MVIKKYIWDTGSLALFFVGHEKARKLMKEITQGKSLGIVPTSILAEFYYKSIALNGKKVVQIQVITIQNSKLQEVTLSSSHTGELKHKYSQLSFADCIIVTHAIEQKAIILTTDNGIKKVKETSAIKLNY